VPIVNDGRKVRRAAAQKCSTWLLFTLKRRGIQVPEDVAVIGFDNVEDAALALDPELTSIDHNDEEIGRKMVELVLASGRERASSPPSSYTVKPRLVLRESA
jgi:LacI family transcriptional regulator